jgi:hypothetical protein
MLWTLKEIKGSPICDLVDKSPHIDDERRNLLDLFQESPATLSSKYPPQSHASVVGRMQMLHMSHLYGAGDLMDWLYPLLRSSVDADTAKERMKKWAAEGPERIRKVAWHSAQTLGIIRLYWYNLSLEAFNAFHAGVVLWFMTALLPQSSNAQIGPIQHQPRSIIRLDDLTTSALTDSGVTTWIRDGNPAIISLYSVPDLASYRGRRLVLEQTADLLRGMRVGVSRLTF